MGELDQGGMLRRMYEGLGLGRDLAFCELNPDGYDHILFGGTGPGGTTERFDRVIIAAHTDETLAMLADATPAEREILGAIRYRPNEAVLHTDVRMLPRLPLARAACANFVNGLRDGDTFAIYSFGGLKVKTLQDFTEVRDVPDSVWDMKPDGETPLYDAIAKAADALAKRPESRRAILVVSDGADTRSKATLDQALRKSLAAQASIYGVDMTDAAVFRSQPRDNGAEVMKELAAKSGGKFFPVAGGSKLRDAFANTIEELRHQYTIGYESNNERFDGRWRAIEVKLNKPLLNVRSRQGYYAQKKRG